MKRLSSLVLVVLLPAPLLAQAHAEPHTQSHTHAHTQTAAHWSYEGDAGPRHWGELEADYSACRTGKHQSPIDLHGVRRADLPKLDFDYHPVPLKVIDNGHTVQVDYAPGSFLTVNGKRYQLVQFHFHHPSEETIDGHAYDMVAHLVHKDSTGHLAVVAVLLKRGQANPMIQSVWDHLPRQVGHEDTVANVQVNAADLLPRHTGYYAFEGSLTTPPCTEGVHWLVLSEPQEISPEELATFSKLYRHDARPTQPLNGRAVQESK